MLPTTTPRTSLRSPLPALSILWWVCCATATPGGSSGQRLPADDASNRREIVAAGAIAALRVVVDSGPTDAQRFARFALERLAE
jgi:hypothetical protein